MLHVGWSGSDTVPNILMLFPSAEHSALAVPIGSRDVGGGSTLTTIENCAVYDGHCAQAL
jgi:hypothetical protein